MCSSDLVERFNRTLREVMSRLMEHRDSTRYVDVLDEIVDVTTRHLIAGTVGCQQTQGMMMMCRDCGYRDLKGRQIGRASCRERV